MIVDDRIDLAASGIAAAIGEPARARMLYALMDGIARTSTELAAIADVSPSTASVHLQRLTSERLTTVVAQGRHRFHRLASPDVARMLERLNVLASERVPFVPGTPERLREARTCYDHLAGALAVSLHDRFIESGWLAAVVERERSYDVTALGNSALEALGIDVAMTRGLRRRFAYGCLDWSERRSHVGGALGAALLELLLRRRWVSKDDDCRALSVTTAGRNELYARFELNVVAGRVRT